MKSSASTRFKSAIEVANRILLARDRNDKGEDRVDFYHAAWAAYVASWDNYIKAVCKEFTTKSNVGLLLNIDNQAVVAFQAKHDIVDSMFTQHLKRFNTPSYDKAREFILMSTGVDMLGQWGWVERNIVPAAVKPYLDEVVKVRHSFAHGFPLQQIPNLHAIDGNQLVTYKKAIFARGLLCKLVSITDRALDSRLKSSFQTRF